MTSPAIRRVAAALLAGIAVTACDKPPTAHSEASRASAGRSAPAQLDGARLSAADREPENWFTVHRSGAHDHYSPLTQIDQSNVGSLGFAWEYDTQSTRGLEASPLVIDGVMYTSGNWGRVYALDAATGERIWQFDPQVPGEWGRRACCDVVNRGVAAWNGRIYVASLDGYLIALDAANGDELWRADTLVDRTRYQTITGAPQVAGENVVIGNGGAELGVRGYVTAFNLETGELAWRFYTVPGDPDLPFEHPELEMASATWDPDSMWDVGGGGTAWDSMAYDADLNLVYVGTGNGSPHPVWSRSPAGGDNLFLASILAIDADTGRLRWHYQTTPGDSWDYTATQHIVLADLDIDGAKRKVLMQAPKNGFFYVLDRETGELLSAEKFGKVNWASHVDLETGRPVLTAQSDFSKGPKLIYPGQVGAHNWHPMSFSAQTGLVYIPLIERGDVYSFEPKPRYVHGESAEHVVRLRRSAVAEQLPAGVDVERLSYLQAWDPVAGVERWRITLDSLYNGAGVLATGGGLVFQGSGDGFLYVYAAETGARLAAINVGTSMMAAPISYAVDGEQYVAIMAGWGGPPAWSYPRSSAAYRYGNAGRIVAFKLNGGPVPRPPVVEHRALAMPPEVPSTPEMIERGAALFNSYRCSWCHSHPAGTAPSLLAMSAERHGIFKEIVLDGALEARGMAGFGDLMSVEEAEAIHAYIVDLTRRTIAQAK